jgi:hypothetical protein
MKQYVNDIQLDNPKFERDGYLPIRGLLTPEAVAGLREFLAQQAGEQSNTDGARVLSRKEIGGDFARYTNALDLDHELIRRVYEAPAFRALFARLGDGKWLLTAGFGFALAPGNQGLMWHFAFRTFSAIQPDDPAHTLWIPLDEIDPARQGGGMVMASSTVYSGREETKLLVQTCKHADDQAFVKDTLSRIPNFRAARDAILEKNGNEDPYTPGDALLFDRYTFHRSVPLRPGPISVRRALALRIISANATFNPALYEAQVRFFTGAAGVPAQSEPLGARLTDIEAGTRVSESRYPRRLY